MLTRQLMLRTRLPRLISKTYETRNYGSKVNPSASSTTELDIDRLTRHEVRLSSHKPKQKQRQPFAKNFYLGLYDTELCAFPEPQTHDRHADFFAWLKPIEDYVSGIDISQLDKSSKIPAEIIDQMIDLDVFRAGIPEDYKGLELNNSEYSKLIETFSRVPVLGAYLVKRAIAINYIIKYASDDIKSRYLPRIASGELIPTVCINEDEQGADDAPIVSKARLSDCENFWHINGNKRLIADAQNANLFIVFAECSESNTSFHSEESTTAFLVEKDFGNINISLPINTVGLRGLDLCDVYFKSTVVPKENMIGEIGMAGKAFTQIFSEGKHFIGAQAIGLTKGFLKEMVKNLKHSKNFNTLKFQSDSIHDAVSKIACYIYGMESVTYLTCGMMDTFADQDCAVESCMAETYCADECIQAIIHGMQILGVDGHIKTNVFQQYLRDAVCLISFNGPITSTKTFISLVGIQHTGRVLGDEIKAQRNLWNFPKKALKLFIAMDRKEKLLIPDNLHPSLFNYAEMLEEGIYRLKKVIQELAIRDGIELLDRHVTLRRISETATYLYVMAAVLARASRSYCLGMRDSEKELKISQVFAYMLYERFSKLAEQLESGEWVNGDGLMREISDGCFEKGQYYAEHPLARNF